jgi:5-methyltetrahydropteroyltriglutamate--homocysteine methyltransferase
MARTAVLGLPRIGPNRELKGALESYWAGRIGEPELRETVRALRAASWGRARAAGIDAIPSGDFSLYDHVLDAAWGVGAVPERLGGPGAEGLGAYFACARGTADARPLEMTKWFDTNYHYLVPELAPRQPFRARPDHWIDQLRESRDLGIETRPVMLGPASLLLLSKGLDRPLDALDALMPAYADLLRALADAGARDVQVDEPCLALDRTDRELDAILTAWRSLAAGAGLEICLATYFAGLRGRALEEVLALPVAEVHLDLVRAPQQLGPALDLLGGSRARLSLGVIDGRNVWAADLDGALRRLDVAVTALGEERVTIAPSCSLLHLPHSAAREASIADEVRPWLAFADERLAELGLLHRALAAPAERDDLLAGARQVAAARRASARTVDPAVRERVAALRPADYDRASPAGLRRAAQRARAPLPVLPTTTIGSFPQTDAIRAARRELRAGALGAREYRRFLEERVAEVVAAQEEIGLDVLVHGEPERSDMVEYFGQQLRGFAFSEHGWVQSYGSRCVKPPILYGDVSRPEAMTVGWWRHAQSLTDRPVKGMLTGPVTILQWSFVRDDQPREETCAQIALAIQDEVLDLEQAGAFAIQVDEAALREGLPLHADEQDAYVRWAVDCFRLATAPVRDETQVHTHMCYSEFGEIIDHIVRLDADVLSIEASRSGMELLGPLGDGAYPNDIGPGVYDIHSPRVPEADEIERLLALAEERVGRARLWVNPDCGLKTRTWDEVLPALRNMVEATRRRRAAGEGG